MTRLWGVRPSWRTEVLGEFFCPGCGGDRNYRRQRGRRWLRLCGAPALPLGQAGTSVQCTACRSRYAPSALERPTCTKLSGMLRDAQYTIALAVLAAGGAAGRQAREAACEVIREAGFEDCGEVQVLASLAALSGLGSTDAPHGSGSPLDEAYGGIGSGLAIELHAALEPLAPHLAPQGLERLLLQGAWIALADGPYRPAERDALAAVGHCLHLGTEQIAELLEAAARTPHP
ncbi:TerB family tellurite resistance protein [Peterkaempfera bronchialis]|uniref:TerB family tellurite resistance protein n=1 Tax=Peterkaempfera bronchialis TaxID=2126346 RepID=A0A345SUT9_9ACTN|nr:TerB family tellurite resistance protein [Peterkaempfera bronchialis]AXI77494.1 TerB family tellurite resistance protein [Peterkaempfera bronchialis]